MKEGAADGNIGNQNLCGLRLGKCFEWFISEPFFRVRKRRVNYALLQPLQICRTTVRVEQVETLLDFAVGTPIPKSP